MRTLKEVAQIVLDNIENFVIDGLLSSYTKKPVGLCYIIATLWHSGILSSKDNDIILCRIYKDMYNNALIWADDDDNVESKWLFSPGLLEPRIVYLKGIIDENDK